MPINIATGAMSVGCPRRVAETQAHIRAQINVSVFKVGIDGGLGKLLTLTTCNHTSMDHNGQLTAGRTLPSMHSYQRTAQGVVSNVALAYPPTGFGNMNNITVNLWFFLTVYISEKGMTLECEICPFLRGVARMWQHLARSFHVPTAFLEFRLCEHPVT